MKQATLNSLIRSLADVAQVARALRLLSIMLNMALKPYRSTINALIAACARDFRSLEAARLYWYVLSPAALVPVLASRVTGVIRRSVLPRDVVTRCLL